MEAQGSARGRSSGMVMSVSPGWGPVHRLVSPARQRAWASRVRLRRCPGRRLLAGAPRPGAGRPAARSARETGQRRHRKSRGRSSAEFMQAEGPPAGNSPLPADLSTFPRWRRAEPAIMPLRQMFLPRSGCLPSQDPSRRRRRRSLRPSWVPLTSSGPSTEQSCSTVPDPE
jgi:hypothetical protein